MQNKILLTLLALFCFILIVDPANTLLGVKYIVFVLLFGVCIANKRNIHYRYLIFFVLIYLVQAFSLTVGYSSNKYIYDDDFTLYMIFTYIPLILLPWVDFLPFYKYVRFPIIVISIITIIVSVAMIFNKELELMLYSFFSADTGLMQIAHRSFAGIDFTSAYYRTIPIAIIPFAVIVYDIFIYRNKTLKNLATLVLLGVALLFAGTRACMLSTVIVILMIYMIRLYNSKAGRIILPLVLILVSVGIIFVMSVLLSDATEPSKVVKFGHLHSYAIFFQNNIDALLFGQGPGGMFYSMGFGEMTSQTEWTLIEFVRMYGILGTFILLVVYLYPLIELVSKRHLLPYALPISIGYMFYFMIGCTNPLLTSSTGMLAILIVYSYVRQSKLYTNSNCAI